MIILDSSFLIDLIGAKIVAVTRGPLSFLIRFQREIKQSVLLL